MDYKLYAFADEANKMMDGQIAAMIRNGLNGLEIRGVDGENVSKITLEKAKEVRRKLDDNGLVTWSIGSPIGKIALDRWEEHAERLKHTLEIANILGAKNLRMFSFFMEQADILFLSDEAVGDNYRAFMEQLADAYPCRIIVMGRGAKGAAIYLRDTGELTEMPATSAGTVVNTVGAGDALFSAFLHYYTKGLAPLDALQRAQIFATHKITVSGASNGFVSEQTVEEWVK